MDTKEKTVNEFVEHLKTDFALIEKLELLPDNDWPGLEQAVREAGFDVSAEDLQRYMPLGFFKGQGKHTDQGWDLPEWRNSVEGSNED